MNKVTIDKYRSIVGDKIVDKIMEEASPLSEKHIVHVNSTYYGGGVAEILSSLVILMNDAGIKTGWRLLKGNPDFFYVTKSFHNALQGAKIHLTDMKKRVYEECNKSNSIFTHLGTHDCVIVHDPQPLPLINYYKRETKPWVWRCHIDISSPNPLIWDYLKTFIGKYKRMIVSMKGYKQNDIKIPTAIIRPSIDPLSPKNKKLSEVRIEKTLSKFGIERDKPIISQVSRFDKWKDPIGVIKSYRLIKKKFDCRLVLLGSMATDDPEGQKIFEHIRRYVGEKDDIKLINFENNILVNSLQRVSSVVIQKSIKEGFALTVSEALWKKVPVVGSRAGGIPTQIIDGKNGYLVNDYKECAARVIKLLREPELAKKMGEYGHEHVKKNFLVTRHVLDYANLLKKVLKNKSKK